MVVCESHGGEQGGEAIPLCSASFAGESGRAKTNAMERMVRAGARKEAAAKNCESPTVVVVIAKPVMTSMADQESNLPS